MTRLGPPISGATVIVRAHSWLRPSVPHDTNGRHRNEFGMYRTDSSGYVAMAWQLPETALGGADIDGLVAASDRIEKPEILPGDVLLRGAGTPLIRHVAIFEEWFDDGRTAFWGLEQRRGLGAIRRRIRYPYENSSRHYRPYRYLNLTSADPIS